MGLTCFSIMPSFLVSLPTSPEVVAGSANISVVDQHAMIIEVQDQSIINYDSFNIAAQEMVRFVQPSSSSVVLNRVTGSEGSEILGKMQSNGKVFLVNPNGVFFGSEAQVDMGSLITSTLDIIDSDFLNGNFEFTLRAGNEEASIVNMGMLKARGEGSVALISPNVRNEGTIIAHTGKVALLSGEKVVLDFTGDGLMQFSVEGSLEKAIIEQSGNIQALQGQVHLTMGQVKQVIQNVINTDGVEVGDRIIEENGIIRLTSSSLISSENVRVIAQEGSKVEIRGEVDVSNIDGVGGSIYVFGEEISLVSPNLNASGVYGGGTILVGGDAFGQGPYFKSQGTKVYPGSILTADAAVSGDGGKIIIWSEKMTYFDGFARAQGGIQGGNGGFIETSGKMGLGLAVGHADTSAIFGKPGTWLLDPYAIVINNTGTDSLSLAQNANDLTSTLSINASIFTNATSNITLSAMAEGGSITVAEGTTISMAPGYGITFSVDPESGEVFLADNSQIKTEGGYIAFNGKVVLSGDNATLRTNSNMTSGSIYFGDAVDGTNAALSNLIVDAGSAGSLIFTGAVGANSPLGRVSIDTGTLNLGTNIFTKGQNVSIRGATLLTADSGIDSTYGGIYAGGDISFLGLQSTIDGPYGFVVESGVGQMHFSASVGDSKTLRSFRAKGGVTTLSGSGFITDGNTQIWETAVVVQTDVTFTDNGTSGIYFLSTLNSGTGGAVDVTVSAPIGKAQFVGEVGGISPLASLTVSSSEIVQVNKVTVLSASATSELSYSAPLGISVGGDILAGATGVSAGVLTFNNPVLFTANVGSVATAGTLKLAVLSETSTASTVTINGVTTGSGNLRIDGDAKTQIAFQNAAINLVSLNADADSITQDANSAIFATGSITLDASGGASVKTLSTRASISTTNGTITLNGGALVDSIQSNINAGTGNIVLTPLTIPMSYQGVVQTTGGSVTFESGGGVGAILTGASKVDVGDGAVTFNELEGANSLTISGGGVASLTLAGVVGGTTPLTSLIADIGSITQSSTVEIDGDLTYVAPLGLTVGGDITTTSGNVTVVGPTTLTSGPITITSSGDISFSGDTSTIISPTPRVLTLTPGVSSIVTLGGAIGTGNPLASLSVTRGSQVNVGSNITVFGSGAISVTPAVVLIGDSTMTSTSGAITFDDTLNGTQALNINTGGVVTFDGIVGGVNYLARLNVTGSSIAVNTTAVNVVGGETILNAPTALGANVTFNNNGDGVAFLGAISGAGSSTLTVNSPTGNVRFGSTIANTVGTVTVTALDVEQLGAITPVTGGSIVFSGSNSILLGANITATGAGVITMNNPVTLGTTVTLTTATGAVNLAGVSAGSDGLTISSTSGVVTLGSAPYSLSSLAVSSGGAVSQTSVSPITTIGLLSLTSTAGSVTTAASLISEGGNIVLNAGTTLGITSNIATTGGNITLAGTTSITYNGGTISTGNGNLTVGALTLATAGTAVNIGSGTGTFSGTINGAVNFSVNGSAIGALIMSGAVGGTFPLASLRAEVGRITQLSAVSTLGAVSYDAVAGLTLGGGITTSLGSGTITVMGPTTLATGTIALAANANISFIGEASSIDGARPLTFSSGSANIRLDGAIGLNTALTSLATTSTGNTLIASSITTTGAQTFGAVASSGNILLTGPVVIGTTNSAVTFNGTINGAQSLFVNAGSATVTYTSAVGAVTPLTTLDTIGGTISINASIKTR